MRDPEQRAKAQRVFIDSNAPPRHNYGRKLRGEHTRRPSRKLRGIQALYWRYLYLLGKTRQGRQYPRRLPAQARKYLLDIEKMERQFLYLHQSKISDTQGLANRRQDLERIIMLQTQQKMMLKKEGLPTLEVNQAIANARKELKMIQSIEERAEEARRMETEAKAAKDHKQINRKNSRER